MTHAITVAQWGGKHVEATNPDATVSMADLAVFCLFDSDQHGNSASLAFDAVGEAYQPPEITASEFDYYDGWFVTFADKSVLRYRKPD